MAKKWESCTAAVSREIPSQQYLSRKPLFLYTPTMTLQPISAGVTHNLPADLKKALTGDKPARTDWENITPLARNEWICWTISVKKPETRKEHVGRVVSQLKEGKHRPCCWPGCPHRRDKSINPTQKFLLAKRSKKS